MGSGGNEVKLKNSFQADSRVAIKRKRIGY